MATFLGNDGTISVGGNVVAEVVSFSLNESSDRIEDTVLGDTNRTYKAGLPDVNGTITCRYDHTDSTGQEAMTNGATVTLVLRPVGATAGYQEATVSATITAINIETEFNTVVPRTFNWEAAGALVWSAIV